jgi:hypothetical protein
MAKRGGVLLEPREFPCDFFLWRYMKDLIDTIEILRERVKNTATTIRNNRGMLERVEESFRRDLMIVLTITVIILNTSCND